MRGSVEHVVRQSPPVNTTLPYDDSTIRGKTILITGGASGFGEGFARRWAAAGAHIIIADINDTKGAEVVASIRTETGNNEIHYVHCDVTDWQSQVDLFHKAVALSPTKGIDSVIVNAGITDKAPMFWQPTGLDAPTPPKPNFACIDVNMIGALYTTHLALFYLPRNPNSKAAGPDREPVAGVPDRHILLLGSVASLAPITFLPLYGTSKHALLGLFRSLRTSSFIDGIRVNMLCPYFIDTPLINFPGRVILAGTALGKPDDVVDAATRLVADTRIAGRALVVGPKVKLDNEGNLLEVGAKEGIECASWECYADDLVKVGESMKWYDVMGRKFANLMLIDAWTHRFVGVLNAIEHVNGWVGWGKDMLLAIAYPFKSLLKK